jgi:hypothetical protein
MTLDITMVSSFRTGECEGQKTVDGKQMPPVLIPWTEERDHRCHDRGPRRRCEGQPGVTGQQGHRQQRRTTARLRRSRRRGVFNAVVEALGWPDIRYVGSIGAEDVRPRPCLDRERRGPPRAVRLLPP